MPLSSLTRSLTSASGWVGEEVVDHDRQLVHHRRGPEVGHLRSRCAAQPGDAISELLNESRRQRHTGKRVVERQLTPPLDHAP